MADARSRWIGVLLVALSACKRCNGDDCDDGECIAYDPTTSTSSGGGEDVDDTLAPETTEPGTSDDGSDPGTSSSEGGNDGQCQGTDECPDAFCVAPYADNVRGDFACVEDCVGPNDEAKWCFDDAACCDPLTHCTIRGYCELESDTTSGGESSGESSGSSSSSSSTG